MIDTDNVACSQTITCGLYFQSCCNLLQKHRRGELGKWNLQFNSYLKISINPSSLAFGRTFLPSHLWKAAFLLEGCWFPFHLLSHLPYFAFFYLIMNSSLSCLDVWGQTPFGFYWEWSTPKAPVTCKTPAGYWTPTSANWAGAWVVTET